MNVFVIILSKGYKNVLVFDKCPSKEKLFNILQGQEMFKFSKIVEKYPCNLDANGFLISHKDKWIKGFKSPLVETR